jgi:hypothetical protein
VLVAHETASELETRDLEHLVICQCRKHRQLAYQVGGFATYFSLNILMVHLPKPVVITDGRNLFGVELAWGETIHFRNLEFITECFDNLSLSLEVNDSSVVFIGMAHSRSPSSHGILEESTSKDDSTSSEG